MKIQDLAETEMYSANIREHLRDLSIPNQTIEDWLPTCTVPKFYVELMLIDRPQLAPQVFGVLLDTARGIELPVESCLLNKATDLILLSRHKNPRQNLTMAVSAMSNAILHSWIGHESKERPTPQAIETAWQKYDDFAARLLQQLKLINKDN